MMSQPIRLFWVDWFMIRWYLYGLPFYDLVCVELAPYIDLQWIVKCNTLGSDDQNFLTSNFSSCIPNLILVLKYISLKLYNPFLNQKRFFLFCIEILLICIPMSGITRWTIYKCWGPYLDWNNAVTQPWGDPYFCLLHIWVGQTKVAYWK